MKSHPRPVRMTEFTRDVIELVKVIPRGRVATYGQIATLAGRPHGARGVSWILNSCSKVYNLPWQRVINAKGKISFRKGTSDYRKQKSLLVSEGVRFAEDEVVSLELFGWKKKPKRKNLSRKDPKQPQMFD